MSNWNKIFKPIVVLCAICIVITGALAATNGVTAPIIEAATAAAQEAARMELVPEATSFTQVEGVSAENVSGILYLGTLSVLLVLVDRTSTRWSLVYVCTISSSTR